MSTSSITNAMGFWVRLSVCLPNGRWGECLGETCLETDILFKILVEIAHLTWRHIYFSPQLSVPAQINAYVQPATLPTVDTPELYGGAICTVSGWGVTRIYSFHLSPILRAVDVSIMSNCQYYYYYRGQRQHGLCGLSLRGKRRLSGNQRLMQMRTSLTLVAANGIERTGSRHFFSASLLKYFSNIQPFNYAIPHCNFD